MFILLDADHIGLAQFPSKDNVNFKRVLEVLVSWAASAAKTQTSPTDDVTVPISDTIAEHSAVETRITGVLDPPSESILHEGLDQLSLDQHHAHKPNQTIYPATIFVHLNHDRKLVRAAIDFEIKENYISTAAVVAMDLQERTLKVHLDGKTQLCIDACYEYISRKRKYSR
jgi:hypothetical protein